MGEQIPSHPSWKTFGHILASQTFEKSLDCDLEQKISSSFREKSRKKIYVGPRIVFPQDSVSAQFFGGEGLNLANFHCSYGCEKKRC